MAVNSLSLLILLACVIYSQAWPVKQMQERKFDLHEAMGYAYDRESLRALLKDASVEEVKAFLESLKQDLADIEALNDKLINHDWTTQIELSEEEYKLFQHLVIMDTYMPSVGDYGTSLFLDTCKQEYEQADFSSFATFEEARMDAMRMIITCGSNGFRTLEAVLDVSGITEKDLECIDGLVQKIDRLARGLSELFTLSRFFRALMTLDSSKYTDPQSLNKALKDDAVRGMHHGGKHDHDDDDDDNTDTKDRKAVGLKGVASSLKAMSARMDRIKEIKTRMLLEKVLKSLENSRKK